MSSGECGKEELAQLLENARRGDGASLNMLCKELDAPIRSFFWKKFRDDDLVDDLCQDTQIRLVKNLDKVRDPMCLKGFAVKVAIHVSQEHLRKRYRRPEESLDAHISNSESMISDLPSQVGGNGFREQIMSKADVDHALAQLPDTARRILKMKADGYTYEEISAEMGLTVSGVKMQVKRNLEKVRDALNYVAFFAMGAILTMETLGGWC